MSEQHHNPHNPVASAYFEAVCSLDSLTVDVDAIAHLTMSLESSETFDEGAKLSFHATTLALEHVVASLKREQARFEALCAAQRVAPSPAAVA